MAGKAKIKTKNRFCAEALTFDDGALVHVLCGEHDKHIKLIEKSLAVSVSIRGQEVHIRGAEEAVFRAKRLLQNLYFVLESGRALGLDDIEHAIT